MFYIHRYNKSGNKEFSQLYKLLNKKMKHQYKDFTNIGYTTFGEFDLFLGRFWYYLVACNESKELIIRSKV